MVNQPRSGRKTPDPELGQYLRDISAYDLLSKEEEQALAYRIEEGDARAREEMVHRNLRLVVNVARSYQNKGLSLPDLIDEGNLGLLRAAEGYDPRMNTRFSTYATYWIRQSIKRAIINAGKTIRIPAYMHERLTKWQRAKHALENRTGKPPEPREIARRAKLPRKHIQGIMDAQRTVCREVVPLSVTDEQGDMLSESANAVVEDFKTPQPEQDLRNREELEQLRKMIGLLEPRQRTVLTLRFGLEDHEEKTLKYIGELLGLTRERVRQIENDGLNILHEALNHDSD